LRKWFCDGEFRHTCGAKALTAEDKPFDTYSVYRAEDGSLGVVVANYEDRPVSVTLDTGSGRLSRYRLVDHSEWHDADAVTLPAQSAAVVI
jgi:hypothetical protein